jgi:phage terminase small subunit
MTAQRPKKRELTQRQKLFALRVHRGEPPYRAYVSAGFKPDEGHPYRLAGNGRVQQYLSELGASLMKRHNVTVDSLIEELEEARTNAKQAKQPSAEVSAIVAKARLAGLLIDKKEVKNTGIEDMNTEQLIALLREQFGDRTEAILAALDETLH